MTTPSLMKKIVKITGIVAAVMAVAAIAIVTYVRVPVAKTNAQTTSGAPAVSLSFITADGSTSGRVAGIKITNSSGDSFTEDFQLTICVTSVNYSGQSCATTPWASESNGSNAWSNWIWPDYNNGLNTSDPGLVTISVNTKALPQGERLDNVVLGLGVSESNGGPLNSNILSATPCDYGFTPAGGGSSSFVYGHTYGDCSRDNSWYPDIVQVGIKATVTKIFSAQETATNIPATFAPAQTITTGTDGAPLFITMKNTASPWASSFTSKDIDGTQSGTCDYAYKSNNGVKNAPVSGSDNESQCSVSTDITSSDFALVHSGSSFSISPESIPITYHNVTKTTTYYAASFQTIDEPCASGGLLNNNLNFLPSGVKRIFSFLVKSVFAAVQQRSDGYCSKNVRIPASWDVSYSGGGYSYSVRYGESVTFPISSITAPSAPGTHKETWQMQQGGTSFNDPFVKEITVSNTATVVANGTLNVSSTNAATGALVASSWIATGPTTVSSTNQESASYTVPVKDGNGNAATYDLIPTDGSAGSQYSLNVVKQAPIVANAKQNIVSRAFTALRNAVTSVALANTSCIPSVYVFDSSANTYTCSGGAVPAASVDPKTNTVSFVILWDPIPAMSIAPASLDLGTSGATSGSVTVQNTGAPGSALAWTSSVTYSGGATGWLTPETASGAVTNAAGQSGTSGNTGTASFALTAAASSMATGTYTANVKFVGTSPLCPKSNICGTQDVTVTLTIGGGGGGTCTGASCATTPTSTTPTPTSTSPTSTQPTNPTSTTSGTKPSCTLSASPTSIVVPASAKLTYSCANVSSCTMSGGGFGTSSLVTVNGNSTAKGSTTDAPTTNTFYNINCYGTGSYSGTNASASVEVKVTNPGRVETSTF